MKNANVLLFDDSVISKRDPIETALREAGHTVVARAESVAGAIAIMAYCNEYDMPIDLILSDANFDRNGIQDGAGAKVLWDESKRLYRDAIFIGISGSSMKNYGVPLRPAHDPGEHPQKILECISNL